MEVRMVMDRDKYKIEYMKDDIKGQVKIMVTIDQMELYDIGDHEFAITDIILVLDNEIPSGTVGCTL